MAYLLDTNILSEPMRPAPDTRLIDWLSQNASDIGIPSPVWHELMFGYHRLSKSSLKKTVGAYVSHVVLTRFPILDYTQDAAEWHAKERARLESVGLTPPFADGQIAAIAAVNSRILVTRDKKGFRNFQGLQIKSWP